jgi:hypothetical protein
MEEVIGSIPIRSTNNSTTYGDQLPYRGFRRVLKLFRFRFQEHRDQVVIGRALLLGHRVRVNVERRPTVRMPQQFLRYLHINAHRP